MLLTNLTLLLAAIFIFNGLFHLSPVTGVFGGTDRYTIPTFLVTFTLAFFVYQGFLAALIVSLIFGIVGVYTNIDQYRDFVDQHSSFFVHTILVIESAVIIVSALALLQRFR